MWRCSAGATDDDILAVFEHHPIGGGQVCGGWPPLSGTHSGAARDYVDTHPPPVPSGRWLRRCEIGCIRLTLPTTYHSKNSALTAIARVSVIWQWPTPFLRFSTGTARRAGLSACASCGAANLGGLATAARALDRLTPWFVQPVETDGGGAADAAHVYELSPALSRWAGLVRTHGTPTT